MTDAPYWTAQDNDLIGGYIVTNQPVPLSQLELDHEGVVIACECHSEGFAPLIARLLNEEQEPRLGLATTKELLDEVATRMLIGQNSIKGRELGRLCQEAILNLEKQVLEYRTVGSW